MAKPKAYRPGPVRVGGQVANLTRSPKRVVRKPKRTIPASGAHSAAAAVVAAAAAAPKQPKGKQRQQTPKRKTRVVTKVVRQPVKAKPPKRGQAPAKQQSGNVMPDFLSNIPDVPTYDQILAGMPSVQDLLGMVGGGSSGSTMYSSTPAANVQPVTTTPVANDISTLASNLAGAYGNNATADITQAGQTASGFVPSQFTNTAAADANAAALAMSSGNVGGTVGSSRGSINPYSAASTLQKMIQAEAMFGPKLMAQYLKNQGYTINNMRDYQSAWIDQAMFGPQYAYAVGKVANIRASTKAKNVATAITMALAGPRVQSEKATVAGKVQNIKYKKALQPYKIIGAQQGIRSKNIDIMNKSLEATLKGLGIKGKQLDNLYKKARNAQKKRNHSQSQSTINSWNDRAGKIADKAYNNKDVWGGIKPLSYQMVIKQGVSRGIPTDIIVHAANQYYKPGQYGRPAKKVRTVKGHKRGR